MSLSGKIQFSIDMFRNYLTFFITSLFWLLLSCNPTISNLNFPKIETNPHSFISDTPCIPKIDTLDGSKVHRLAEFPCEFPGGQAELTRYLQRNLRYPKNQDDMQSSIKFTFIVDTLGNIRNPCVLLIPYQNNLSPFDSLVISMFQTMPKWVPAQINGKKIYYRHIQSIAVNIDTER